MTSLSLLVLSVPVTEVLRIEDQLFSPSFVHLFVYFIILLKMISLFILLFPLSLLHLINLTDLSLPDSSVVECNFLGRYVSYNPLHEIRLFCRLSFRELPTPCFPLATAISCHLLVSLITTLLQTSSSVLCLERPKTFRSFLNSRIRFTLVFDDF